MTDDPRRCMSHHTYWPPEARQPIELWCSQPGLHNGPHKTYVNETDRIVHWWWIKQFKHVQEYYPDGTPVEGTFR